MILDTQGHLKKLIKRMLPATLCMGFKFFFCTRNRFLPQFTFPWTSPELCKARVPPTASLIANNILGGDWDLDMELGAPGACRHTAAYSVCAVQFHFHGFISTDAFSNSHPFQILIHTSDLHSLFLEFCGFFLKFYFKFWILWYNLNSFFPLKNLTFF